MRHPLTGGGMTVALNDALLLARQLLALAGDDSAHVGGVEGDNQVMGAFGGAGAQGPLADWERVKQAAAAWAWARRPMASTVNILSIALYDLFGAEGEFRSTLETGKCGG
jgi:squalene monooxygenase